MTTPATNLGTRTAHILRLAGRCSDGSERGKGSRFHAVPTGMYRALCGARPGRHSAGWSWTPGDAVTCPRCLAAIRRATGERG